MKKRFIALFTATFFFVSLNAQNETQILNHALISAKNSFDILESTEAKDPVSFQQISLFKRPISISNTYYDAIVFKTRKGGYLYWSFQMDTTYIGAWYMIKCDKSSYWSFLSDSTKYDSSNLPLSKIGEEKKNINYFSDFSFNESALSHTSLFTMGQKSVLKLEANTEYIIWFQLKNNDLPIDGVQTIISLNLLDDNGISVKDFFSKYFELSN